MRKADVYIRDIKAGQLTEDENGYLFRYDEAYLTSENAEPACLTLPLTHLPYRSTVLFPFFDGLIPEGWLLDLMLDGKRKQIKKKNFEQAMASSGLEAKVMENIFNKFRNAAQQWYDFIDISFLPVELKNRYKEEIAEKQALLS